jgi:hypothetical protein
MPLQQGQFFKLGYCYSFLFISFLWKFTQAIIHMWQCFQHARTFNAKCWRIGGRVRQHWSIRSLCRLLCRLQWPSIDTCASPMSVNNSDIGDSPKSEILRYPSRTCIWILANPISKFLTSISKLDFDNEAGLRYRSIRLTSILKFSISKTKHFISKVLQEFRYRNLPISNVTHFDIEVRYWCSLISKFLIFDIG